MKQTTAILAAVFLVTGCVAPQMRGFNGHTVRIHDDATGIDKMVKQAIEVCGTVGKHPKWMGYEPRGPVDGTHSFLCVDEKADLLVFGKESLRFDPVTGEHIPRHRKTD